MFTNAQHDAAHNIIKHIKEDSVRWYANQFLGWLCRQSDGEKYLESPYYVLGRFIACSRVNYQLRKALGITRPLSLAEAEEIAFPKEEN